MLDWLSSVSILVESWTGLAWQLQLVWLVQAVLFFFYFLVRVVRECRRRRAIAARNVIKQLQWDLFRAEELELSQQAVRVANEQVAAALARTVAWQHQVTRLRAQAAARLAAPPSQPGQAERRRGSGGGGANTRQASAAAIKEEADAKDAWDRQEQARANEHALLLAREAQQAAARIDTLRERIVTSGKLADDGKPSV